MKKLLTLSILGLALILDVETVYASSGSGYNNYIYEVTKAQNQEVVTKDISNDMAVALRSHR